MLFLDNIKRIFKLHFVVLIGEEYFYVNIWQSGEFMNFRNARFLASLKPADNTFPVLCGINNHCDVQRTTRLLYKPEHAFIIRTTQRQLGENRGRLVLR